MTEEDQYYYQKYLDDCEYQSCIIEQNEQKIWYYYEKLNQENYEKENVEYN